MAKAHITTKQGVSLTLELTSKEITTLIKQLQLSRASIKDTTKEIYETKKQRARHSQKATPTNLLESLIDGGFFKKPKDLAAIKAALGEMGHPYPLTTLSPTLLRLVRKRQLRRMKDKNRWVYIALSTL